MSEKERARPGPTETRSSGLESDAFRAFRNKRLGRQEEQPPEAPAVARPTVPSPSDSRFIKSFFFKKRDEDEKAEEAPKLLDEKTTPGHAFHEDGLYFGTTLKSTNRLPRKVSLDSSVTDEEPVGFLAASSAKEPASSDRPERPPPSKPVRPRDPSPGPRATARPQRPLQPKARVAGGSSPRVKIPSQAPRGLPGPVRRGGPNAPRQASSAAPRRRLGKPANRAPIPPPSMPRRRPPAAPPQPRKATLRLNKPSHALKPPPREKRREQTELLRSPFSSASARRASAFASGTRRRERTSGKRRIPRMKPPETNSEESA